MPSIIRRKLSKISLSNRAKSQKSKGALAPSHDVENSSPHQENLLYQLNDDMVVYILSFVSYAPYERSHPSLEQNAFIEGVSASHEDVDHQRLFVDYTETLRSVDCSKPTSFTLFKNRTHGAPVLKRSGPCSRLESHFFGTLTHVLPLVCQRFRDYCRADFLWAEAIERLVASDPNGWGLAVRRYAGDFGTGFTDSVLISKACAEFRALRSTQMLPEIDERESIARLVLRHISREAQPQFFQGPLFHIPCSAPKIGQKVNFHMNEPLYRFMIEDSTKRLYSCKGASNRISGNRPRLICWYGVIPPVVAGDRVVIAELAHSEFDKARGRANLTIVPVQHAKIMWKQERKSSHGLLGLLDVHCQTTPKVLRERTNSKGGEIFHGPAVRVRATAAPPSLGMEFPLHIYEPRYIQMIGEITEDVLSNVRGGEPIPCLAKPHSNEFCHRPRFVIVHGQSMARGEDASVVEVRRCKTTSSDTKEITIVPIQRAIITAVRERPGSSLVDATVHIRSRIEQ